jgi:putative addiction module component (TIGR02574 family)
MQFTPDEIALLTPQERLSLIERLWDSLSDLDVSLTPAQKNELVRRMDNFDRDRALAISWNGLKAELARRCP